MTYSGGSNVLKVGSKFIVDKTCVYLDLESKKKYTVC